MVVYFRGSGDSLFGIDGSFLRRIPFALQG